jgi:hypothetical protein
MPDDLNSSFYTHPMSRGRIVGWMLGQPYRAKLRN